MKATAAGFELFIRVVACLDKLLPIGFHALAAFSLATLALGIVQVRGRNSTPSNTDSARVRGGKMPNVRK